MKEVTVSTYLALGSEGNRMLIAFCTERDVYRVQFYMLS